MSALRRAVAASEVTGVYAVEVRAKTPRAKEFYEKYGFRRFPDDPLHLFLPIASVRDPAG